MTMESRENNKISRNEKLRKIYIKIDLIEMNDFLWLNRDVTGGFVASVCLWNLSLEEFWILKF